ncbi:hypothetical protein ACJX0J_017558, partial [Zea mays]
TALESLFNNSVVFWVLPLPSIQSIIINFGFTYHLCVVYYFIHFPFLHLGLICFLEAQSLKINF